MALVRPRLNDHHGLAFTQDEVDFAIPYLDEDIPLYVDPFLLSKSPSMQEQGLHTAFVNWFNRIGKLALEGREGEATAMLVLASECREVGLGTSQRRRGVRIAEQTASEILSLYRDVPQIRVAGVAHVEEIQLLVDNVSKDRISDFTCTFLKSHLIDYTIDRATRYGIPTQRVTVTDIYDNRRHEFVDEDVELPCNPESGEPILLVPKHWLRRIPWINFEDYLRSFDPETLRKEKGERGRVAILNYNRHNYGAVKAYIEVKERSGDAAGNDPLFTPISAGSARGKLQVIKSLPSGKTENADKKYEDAVCQLLASLLYPSLDFAAEQSRTDSGVLIRDLIFYNNRSVPFLKDIYDSYGSRQIVMELKNVAKVEREHVNQLNRYLNDEMGRFGVLVTRNRLPRNIFKNTIDLWSGQRRAIVALTDEDLELMVDAYESKQRPPLDILRRTYLEFSNARPS